MDKSKESENQRNGLAEYETWLKELAVSNSPTVVFNDGKEHAAILFRTLFENATRSVCIYCEQMDENVTDTCDYYDALKSCVDREVEVRIILNSSDKTIRQHRIFEVVKEESVKCLPDSRKDEMKQILNGLGVHYTVIDDKMYRMEYDTENFKAIASFNDPKIGGALTEAFETVWNRL